MALHLFDLFGKIKKGLIHSSIISKLKTSGSVSAPHQRVNVERPIFPVHDWDFSVNMGLPSGRCWAFLHISPAGNSTIDRQGTSLVDSPCAWDKPFLFGEGALLLLLVAIGLSSCSFLSPTAAKYLLAILTFVAFCLVPFRLFSYERLLLTLSLTFFPLTLGIGGKDAFTLATLVMIAMGLLHLLALFHPDTRRVSLERSAWVAILIGIAFFGAIQASPTYMPQQARHFANFLSSIVLFLLLINAPSLYGIRREVVTRRLSTLLLSMIALQIIIGLLVLYAPGFGDAFRVFVVRTKEALTISGDASSAIRLSSIAMASEELGEILAMLLPIVLYMALEKNRWHWLTFGLFAAALLFNNTRSAMLLAALSCAALLAIRLRHARTKDMLIILGGIPLAAAVFTALEPRIVIAVVKHLGVAVQRANDQQDLLNVLNRESVWPDAWRVVVSTVSLFGNGPAPSRVVGLNDLNMHNLYMTLIYQFGIVGSLIYIGLPLSILAALVLRGRRGAGAGMNLACAFSLLVFFANEVKFEFNRSDSYQQIVWAVFALYHLVSRAETPNTCA